MRVLLINPPGWQSGSVSLGLGYLASIMLRDGHEVTVLDETGKTLDESQLARKALEFRPDIVGYHCKTAQANAAARISKAIKDVLPKALHVVGGPHVTLCHEEYLSENPHFDYGFLGEADENFSEFVARVARGEPVDGIPGLAYRKDGRLLHSERKMIVDLDALPQPNFDLIEGFDWAGFRYPLLTSRGCPYDCNFCSVPLISSKRFRQRSPADCIDELRRVKKEKGITCFEILDDNLTLNMKRAKEFCRELIEADLGLSWYCHNGIRADRLDQELAHLMKAAGCTSIAFGIESGDQDVFRRVNKGEELHHITDAIEMTRIAGMQTVGYFIIGLPGDNLPAVKKTIAFQRTLKLDHYVYGIFIPYPGTSGRDDVLKEGRIIRDIKETNHFSDRPQISIEYPYFTKEEIEEAYYLASAGELAEFLDRWGSKGAMENILFVETHPPTYGHRRVSRAIRGGADLLALSAWDGCFELDLKEGWAREVFYYEKLPSRLGMALQLLRIFWNLGKKRYNVALFPLQRRGWIAFVLAAFMALVRAKHTVLYDFVGSRFIEVSLRDERFRRKVKEYLARKLLGEEPPSGDPPTGWSAPRLARLPLRAGRLAVKGAAAVAEEAASRAVYAGSLLDLVFTRKGSARR